jgi:hypothetical protein
MDKRTNIQPQTFVHYLAIIREYYGEREREREESWEGVIRDTTVWRGCNLNIIWQFGRFPGSAG